MFVMILEMILKEQSVYTMERVLEFRVVFCQDSLEWGVLYFY